MNSRRPLDTLLPFKLINLSIDEVIEKLVKPRWKKKDELKLEVNVMGVKLKPLKQPKVKKVKKDKAEAKVKKVRKTKIKEQDEFLLI